MCPQPCLTTGSYFPSWLDPFLHQVSGHNSVRTELCSPSFSQVSSFPTELNDPVSVNLEYALHIL